MHISPEFKHQINLFQAKGGKLNRKRTIYRLNTFLNFCSKNRGKTTPYEVGKKDVHLFFKNKSNLTQSTKRDYWYSIRVLWNILNRPSDPPWPH